MGGVVVVAVEVEVEGGPLGARREWCMESREER